MFGMGASLAYTPSIAILGHHFKQKMSLVNGLVTAGTSVIEFLMTLVVGTLLNNFGLVSTIRYEAGLAVVIIICSLVYKEKKCEFLHTCHQFTKILTLKIAVDAKTDKIPMGNGIKSKLKTITQESVWKNKKFALWSFLVFVALFG